MKQNQGYPLVKMYRCAEGCFHKSLQDPCVIFHEVQQFLFIWNKGMDLLALGRVKGASCKPDDLSCAHRHMVF